jgi:predicted membrane protein
VLRGTSLVLASIFAVCGIIFPYALAQRATALNQSIILLMLAATSGAFIYGVGFQIRTKWLNDLISPAITWPVLALTVLSLLISRS